MFRNTRYCSYKGCHSSTSDAITIFSMPRDPKSQDIWRNFLKECGHESVDQCKLLKLCEYHFKPRDIDETTQQKRLLAGAIPIYRDIREEPILLEVLDEDFLMDYVGISSQSQECHEANSIQIHSEESSQFESNLSGSEEEPKYGLLLNEIEKLGAENNMLKNVIRKLRKSKYETERELKKLKGTLSLYEPDQIEHMSGKKVTWSHPTVQKALMLRYKLGKSFYDNTFRQKYSSCWPSSSTCMRRIKDFKLEPGITKCNVKILDLKMKQVPENRRAIGLIFDEKAIVPSLQRDHRINDYLGKVTLRPSKKICEKEGDDPLAKNALVVLAVGMDIREKEIVGLQYTAGSTDGVAMYKFICDTIKFIEANTSCRIDWIGYDLGPSNVSMLKEFGISLTKDNQMHKTPHPHRPEDFLFHQSDYGHDEKNAISWFRDNDVLISPKFVTEFSLSSNKASFAAVKQVYKIQEKLAFAPTKLKQQHIQPQHYEKMKQNIASEIFSADVCSAIEFLDKKSAAEGKKNSNSWFLQVWLRLHSIMFDKDGWTTENEEKYKDDRNFLKWVVNDFLPNLKFSSRLKCIPGLRMSIWTILNLSEKYFNDGFNRVIPARFLNDAIENIFSIATSIMKKHTARSMGDTLRIISYNQFNFDPIKGSYAWEENGSKFSVDIIGMLKLFLEEEIPEKEESNEPIEIITINDHITATSIFKTSFEFNIFYSNMTSLLNKVMSSIKCEICLETIIDNSRVSAPGSDLLNIRTEIDRSNCGENNNLQTPSHDLMTFLMRLQFIFNELRNVIRVEEARFEEMFILSAEATFMPNEHCISTTTSFISSFIKNRRQSLLHAYHLHKSNKYASKSLV